MEKEKNDKKPRKQSSTAVKPEQYGKPDSKPKTTGELDGKNDSGPDPEIHDREIPPQ
jgi:hypothetical protein